MFSSLPVCLGAMAGGILLAGILPLSFAWAFLPLGLACIAWFWGHRYPQFGLFPLFFLTLGLAQASLYEKGPDLTGISHWLEQGPARLSGIAGSQQYRTEGRWRLDLAQAIVCRQKQCYSLPGKVRIYGKSQPSDVLPGSRVHLSTRLRLPRNYNTPGEFNFRRSLAMQGIYFTAGTESGNRLVVEGTGHFFAPVEIWRFKIGQWIRATATETQAPLLQALLIGDQGLISQDVRSRLGQTGIAHLFSISGLHLGLVAWLLYALGVRLYARIPCFLRWQPPQRTVPVLIVPLLVAYMLLAGGGIATQRALLVVVSVAGLGFFSRHIAPLRLLTAVAFLLLLIMPLSLFSPGFQLTFAGAGGIVWLWPYCEKRLPKSVWLRGPLSMILVTLIATLCTAPWVAYHFHQVSLLGLLVNLWALPIVGFLAVPLGLMAIVTYPVLPAFATAVLKLCGFLLEGVLCSVTWMLDGLPWLVWECWPSVTFLSVLGIASVLWLLRKTAYRLQFVSFGMLLILGIKPTVAPLQVTALSVGQGDAFLVESANQVWLVDGGGHYRGTFDVGQRLLIPAMKNLGIDQLEGVLLTHRHPDHWQGLVAVLKSVPVKEFWAGAPWDEQPAALATVLADRDCWDPTVEPGWHRINQDEEIQLWLWRSPKKMRRENDRSLVLYAGDGDNGVLLTGDLERLGVEALMADGVPGPVTLLKLPHHGSAHSGTRRLIESLGVRQVIVSSGNGNSFRLPSPDLIEWLRQNRVAIHRTDLQGTFRCRLQHGSWTTSFWNRGHFR